MTIRKSEKGYKIYTRVDDDFKAKLVNLADDLGVTQSRLSYICVRIGFNALAPAVNPNLYLSDNKWAGIIKAYQDKINSEIEGSTLGDFKEEDTKYTKKDWINTFYTKKD